MARRSNSGAAFWAKHLVMAMVVIIAAILFVVLMPDNSAPNLQEDKKVKPEKSISKGLSDFYSEFRALTAKQDEEKSEFNLELPDPSLSVEEQLSSINHVGETVEFDWRGEEKLRTFSAGNTLRDAITDFARKEGMRVIWDLNQDFVIKHQFEMEDTITGSLRQIAKAIDSNFEHTVHTFICAEKNTLLVTEARYAYVSDNCMLVR